MNKYLTPNEIADELSVTPKTVREWLRNGQLKGIKVGSSWRVKYDDYIKFCGE